MGRDWVEGYCEGSEYEVLMFGICKSGCDNRGDRFVRNV